MTKNISLLVLALLQTAPAWSKDNSHEISCLEGKSIKDRAASIVARLGELRPRLVAATETLAIAIESEGEPDSYYRKKLEEDVGNGRKLAKDWDEARSHFRAVDASYAKLLSRCVEPVRSFVIPCSQSNAYSETAKKFELAQPGQARIVADLEKRALLIRNSTAFTNQQDLIREQRYVFARMRDEIKPIAKDIQDDSAFYEGRPQLCRDLGAAEAATQGTRALSGTTSPTGTGPNATVSDQQQPAPGNPFSRPASSPFGRKVQKAR